VRRRQKELRSTISALQWEVQKAQHAAQELQAKHDTQQAHWQAVVKVRSPFQAQVRVAMLAKCTPAVMFACRATRLPLQRVAY